MQNVVIERGSVNFEALDAALRTGLGEAFLGLSTGPSEVTVHLVDEITDEQQQQAREIVENHDPNQLTPEQQAELDRQQQLEQAREANAEPFPLDDFDTEPELIQQMAQRIAWLELEVADLRR